MISIGSCGSTSTDATSSHGNITIVNVTVSAYSSSTESVHPGIGGYSRESGAITIDNATVYAFGTGQPDSSSPAIGSNYYVPDIKILHGSDVYAYRGAFIDGDSYADYIGRGGGTYDLDYQGGQILAAITNSIVHKGNYNGIIPSSTTEEKYDTPMKRLSP